MSIFLALAERSATRLSHKAMTFASATNLLSGLFAGLPAHAHNSSKSWSSSRTLSISTLTTRAILSSDWQS
jgi:hypothetical protein